MGACLRLRRCFPHTHSLNLSFPSFIGKRFPAIMALESDFVNKTRAQQQHQQQ